MARIGLNIRVDVQKILKERLYKGEKGVYLDLNTFIDTDKEDTYGNHGFISQATSKEEREQGVQTPILGNCKVFFNDSQAQPTPSHAGQPVQSVGADVALNDDIPF